MSENKLLCDNLEGNDVGEEYLFDQVQEWDLKRIASEALVSLKDVERLYSILSALAWSSIGVNEDQKKYDVSSLNDGSEMTVATLANIKTFLVHIEQQERMIDDLFYTLYQKGIIKKLVYRLSEIAKV